LLEEKNKLNTELLKQIEFNKQLQESASITNSSGKPKQTSEQSVSLNSLCYDVLSKNKNDRFLLFIITRAVTNTTGMQEVATPLCERSGQIIFLAYSQ